MTDFIRGSISIDKKLQVEELENVVSTKQLVKKTQPKRKLVNGKDRKGGQKKIKSEKKDGDIKEEDEEDEEMVEAEEGDLFPSAYAKLKHKKNKKSSEKQSSRVETMNKSQLKDFMSNKDNIFSAKEEKDAKRLLPYLKKEYPNSANRLMKKSLYPGVVLLGSFESVSEMDIVVSLPFGMKGYVKFNEISDQFTNWMQKLIEAEDQSAKKLSSFRRLKTISDQLRKMFYKGQLLKVSVVGLTENKNKEGLHCTLRPEVVNSDSNISNFKEGMTIQGVIHSVEDKGYIVRFGQSDMNGFMGFQDSKYYYPSQSSEELNQFYVGQIIECYINEINKQSGTLTVSASHALVSRAVCKDSEVVTMDSIKAGMLVESKILKVLPNGLHCAFLDYFSGDIFTIHCEKSLDTYKEDQNLKARILFVDKEKKKIGLSCLNHILAFKPYPFGFTQIGNIFKADKEKGAKVEYIEKQEMVLQLPSTSKDTNSKYLKGYLHLQESGFSKLVSLKGKYKVGDIYPKPSRVKHLDYLDGMVTLTSQRKNIVKAIYSYYDMKPGMTISGKIKNIRQDSLEITIADGIYGVVPKTNMVDGHTISSTEKLFRHGQKVTCRVLSVTPECSRLMLTLKTTLIQSQYPIIQSKEDAQKGMISHGYVTNVTQDKVYVSFYGTVFGRADRSETPTRNESLKVQYPVGSIVLARVLGKNDISLDLSFIIDQDDLNIFNNLMQKLIKEKLEQKQKGKDVKMQVKKEENNEEEENSDDDENSDNEEKSDKEDSEEDSEEESNDDSDDE